MTREAPASSRSSSGSTRSTCTRRRAARAGNPDSARYAAPIAVDSKHPLLHCTPLPCFGAGDDARPREGRARRIPPAQPRRLARRHRRQDRRRLDPARLRRLHAARLVRLRSGRRVQRQQVQGRAERPHRRRAALSRLRRRSRRAARTSSTTSSAGSASSSPASKRKGNKGTVDGHFVRVIWEGIQSESGAPRTTSASAPSSSSNNNQERGRKETLMTYRVKNITIAVALALVAALLTSFYVTNYQRNVRQDETNVPIWVAEARHPGRHVRRRRSSGKGMLEKSEIVRRSVVPGAISNPDQVAELVTTQPIYAGEQVSTRRFSTPSQRGIKAQLTGVQRAIADPGRRAPAARRHAQGRRQGRRRRHVRGAPRAARRHVTRIVLRDIEVLRAPRGRRRRRRRSRPARTAASP